MMDAFAQLAERQIAAPRRRILSAAEKRQAKRAEKAQAEQAEQLGAWRHWYRQRERALLEGEYADAARQLVDLLGHLTPEHALLARKRDHGRAEAALIALYGRHRSHLINAQSPS
jgi:hypothetical protein